MQALDTDVTAVVHLPQELSIDEENDKLNIDFNATDILPDKWWELTKNVLSEKKLSEMITLMKEKGTC